MVEIVVRDEGRGLADADLERIFEKFYRADRIEPIGAGPVRGWASPSPADLVEAMGGTLTAHNRGDRSGAEFVVGFPVSSNDG